MKRIFTILLLLVAINGISATTFTVDGVNYTTSLTVSTDVDVTSGISYSGNVTIPSTVTYSGTTYNVTVIGASAFYGCKGLISVTLPNSIKSIGNAAFGGCTGLTTFIIPSSVKFINEQAFFGCTALTSISIPSGVTSIGKFAFSSCIGLKEINVMITTPLQIEGTTFFLVPTNIPLYVPVGSLDLYKNAYVWKNFSNINGKVYSALNEIDVTTYSIKISTGKIHLSNVSGQSVCVYDMLGKPIFKHSNPENDLEISVSQKGIYLLQVNNQIKKLFVK